VKTGRRYKWRRELDLSNSVLEISGQCHNNGEHLPLGSTYVDRNTELANGGPLTFSDYEADGWG
jgi:hypothetical protein